MSIIDDILWSLAARYGPAKTEALDWLSQKQEVDRATKNPLAIVTASSGFSPDNIYSFLYDKPIDRYGSITPYSDVLNSVGMNIDVNEMEPRYLGRMTPYLDKLNQPFDSYDFSNLPSSGNGPYPEIKDPGFYHGYDSLAQPPSPQIEEVISGVVENDPEIVKSPWFLDFISKIWGDRDARIKEAEARDFGVGMFSPDDFYQGRESSRWKGMVKENPKNISPLEYAKMKYSEAKGNPSFVDTTAPNVTYTEAPNLPFEVDYPTSSEFSNLERGIALGEITPEKLARIREQAGEKFGSGAQGGIFTIANSGIDDQLAEGEKTLRSMTLQRIDNRINDIVARRAMSPAAQRPTDDKELAALAGLKQQMIQEQFAGLDAMYKMGELSQGQQRLENTARYNQGLLSNAEADRLFQERKLETGTAMDIMALGEVGWQKIAQEYAGSDDPALHKTSAIIMKALGEARAAGIDPAVYVPKYLESAGILGPEDLAGGAGEMDERTAALHKYLYGGE